MKHYVFCLGLALGIFLLPQSTFAGWMRTYGGEEADGGSRVWQTSDGGYIVVGNTASFGAGLTDIWLLKTDSEGDTLWTKTYGGEHYDVAGGVQQTTDGGYIVVGTTFSFGSGLSDVWLLKIDPGGDTIWTRAYGDELEDGGSDVRQTLDGGYIITGKVGWSSSWWEGDLWLFKMDSLGDTIWTREFGGDFYGFGNCLQQTSDGMYIVAGTQSIRNPEYPWFFKTDAEGNMLWELVYPSSYESRGYSACEASDGGYFFTGLRVWYAYYLLLVKTDSLGNVEWEHPFERTSPDDPYDIQDVGFCVEATSDGGCIVSGKFRTLLRVDEEGDTMWTRDYGCSGLCVRVTSDDGYVVTGSIDGDLYLLKTDAYGDTLAVVEELVPEPVTTWEVLTSIGPQIVLLYSDMPQGFHAEVFDAAGCKVDDICTAGSSGIISWGEGYGSGVYFIRVSDVTDKGAARIVLIH